MDSIAHNKLCAFCLENVHERFKLIKEGTDIHVKKFRHHLVNKIELDRFVKLFGRFVGPLKLAGADDAGYLDCCLTCVSVVKSFCDLYHQLKSLELQLEWKLETLVNILTGASERLLNSHETTFSTVEVDNGISDLRAFRNDIITRYWRKRERSVPRVKVVRFDAADVDAKSVSKLKDERTDDVTHTFASSEVQYCLGWITSFTTVALLAVTPVETTKLVPCELPMESFPLQPDDDFIFNEESEAGCYLQDVSFSFSRENESVENATKSFQPINPSIGEEIGTSNDNDDVAETTDEDNISTTNERGEGVDDTTEIKPTCETNQPSTEKIFSCSICVKKYNHETSLTRHVKQKHPVDLEGKRKIKQKLTHHCLFCKKSFKSYSDLLEHKRRSLKHQLKRRIYLENLKKIKMEQVDQPSPDLHDTDGCHDKNSLMSNKDTKSTSQASQGKLANNSEEKRTECMSNLQVDVVVKEEASAVENLRRYNFRNKRKCSIKLEDSSGGEASTSIGQAERYQEEADNSSVSSHETHESETSVGKPRLCKKYELTFRCKFKGCSKVKFYTKKNYEFHQNLHKPGINKCNFCKTVKRNVLKLSIHEKLKHSPSPGHEIPGKPKLYFTCPRCDCEFHKVHAYQRHFAEAHVWGILKRETRSSVDDEKILKEDVEQAVKQGRIKCSLCNKNLPNFWQLRNHKRIYHRSGDITELEKPIKTKSGDIFICPVMECAQTFKIIKDLQTHKLHHGRFKCNFCDVVKDYAPDLSIHEMEHTTNSEKNNRVQCSRCSYSCNYKMRYIKHHVKTHLNLSTNTQTCTICGSEGFTREFIKKHIGSHHKIEGMDPSQIQRCDHCPAYFNTRKQLRLHMFRNHFQGQCSVCDKSFKESWQLTAHMDQEHLHVKTFPTRAFACGNRNCSRRFDTEAKVNEHKKKHVDDEEDDNNDHDEEQLHICSKCDKQYNSKMSLYQHVRNFHILPLRICSQCGKSFHTKVGLNSHMEHHKKPDEWKFQCATCERKFASKQKVEQHMRTHTKEKPFICQFCGESYAHRHNWRNHMKKKHADMQK